jgi:hypothetical protein
MAEKKFSELTAKGATIADTDLVAISESAGGGSYVSKRVTGANIKALVTDANLTTTDITTNDVSTTKHGFAPKLPGNTTTFLRGDGTYATPASGGLTEFTEAETTAAPNATVAVNSLTPVAGTTNADFAIVPKGNGALLADIPDGTSAGGNKRGAKAVDLQTFRSSATMVASGESATISGGETNTASGSAATVGGGASNVSSSFRTVVSGGILNTASGVHATVGGGYNNASSGESSFTVGQANIASGQGSTATGVSNTASGQYSTALGASTVASGQYSTAMGLSSSTLGIYGRQAYASGAEAVVGDSQISKFILRERTTDNTATTLTTNSSAASTTNQVILSNQSAYRFKGTIVGKQSGSVNAAVWDVDGFIVRGANAATTTLNVSNVNLVQNTPAWGTPTLAADTTNGGLRVQVTGAAATNIQWTCTIETTEVIYA